MLSHELVSGQQRADDELSRDTQLLPVEQLKLLGSFGSTEEQVLSSLRWWPGNLGGRRLSKADVEEMIAAAIRRICIVEGDEMCVAYSGMYWVRHPQMETIKQTGSHKPAWWPKVTGYKANQSPGLWGDQDLPRIGVR